MLLSTLTSTSTKIVGHTEAIKAIRSAGFDAYDMSLFEMTDDNSVFVSDEYMDTVKAIKEAADDCGLVCNQSHAPFVFKPNELGRECDELYREKYQIPRVARAIEIAAYLGAKCIVVHPLQYKYYQTNVEELFEANMKYYAALKPYCERYGIKIAVENMWQRDAKRRFITESVCARPDSFIRYMDALDKNYFTACLDLGHCGLVGEEAEDMIRALGKDRLGALHVHDNNYIDDSHILPYQGKMNWDNITAALHDIGYTGDFTYEADTSINGQTPDSLPITLKYMADLGRFLINKINL